MVSMPMVATLNSKPTSSYHLQPGYLTTSKPCGIFNFNAGLWCTYCKNCKFSHTCELCGCFHPTTNCPTWTSKSGKCQYPYSHPPSIHKACERSVVFSLIRTQTHSCQTSFSFHQTHQSTKFRITHVAHIVTTYLHLVVHLHPCTLYTVVALPHTTCTCICTGSI